MRSVVRIHLDPDAHVQPGEQRDRRRRGLARRLDVVLDGVPGCPVLVTTRRDCGQRMVTRSSASQQDAKRVERAAGSAVQGEAGVRGAFEAFFECIRVQAAGSVKAGGVECAELVDREDRLPDGSVFYRPLRRVVSQ